MQQPGLPLGLELSAQVPEVDVDAVRRLAEVEAPDLLEQVGAGQDLPGMAEERLQDGELGTRQPDRPVAAPDLPATVDVPAEQKP